MNTLNTVLAAVLAALVVVYLLLEGAASLEGRDVSAPYFHRLIGLPSMFLFATGAGALVSMVFHPGTWLLAPIAVLGLAIGAFGLWRVWYVFRSLGETRRRDRPGS